MLTNEQDPDVVAWGLRLFESDPYTNYVNRCFNGVDDEFIAHALQAELSKLAVEEMPECEDEGDERLQVTDYEQGWLHQSVEGQEHSVEEAAMIPSSSCSSPPEIFYHGKEWSSYSLELVDDCASDIEVGNWLNEMVPIPHVPRINGEIPSVDEASLDHQRLLDRLQVYDLVERKVQGDGNCQFRALSDQFYQTPEHHEFVRQQVVNQLKLYPETYEGYVPMAYGDYLENMSRSGQWGDHVTLQAAADLYGVKLIIITSFKDTCYIEILPNVQRSKRVILLSFWAEVHYNSIGDVPAYETKKKKTWQKIRNKRLEFPDQYQ